jgi:hypothetical protein
MDFNEETVKTVQGRLDILRKGIVSEEKSVNYYQTLLEKTPEGSEEYIGICRMYTYIMEEKNSMLNDFANSS